MSNGRKPFFRLHLPLELSVVPVPCACDPACFGDVGESLKSVRWKQRKTKEAKMVWNSWREPKSEWENEKLSSPFLFVKLDKIGGWWVHLAALLVAHVAAEPY